MPFQLPLSYCPICQKPERFKFVRDHRDQEGSFSLYECPNCEIQFWNPFRNPGKEWYENEYDFCARNILIGRVYKGSHKKFFEQFKDLAAGLKVLDIGCGIGEFLSELKKRGCEVWGVDFNKNHTDIARNKFGLENVYTMESVEFLKKTKLPKFDVITLFGVLEHIDNPFELVCEVKKNIKPGGIIVANAPAKNGLLSGKSFRDLPPHHLSLWSRQAISKLFEKIDFNISYFEYLGEFLSFKSVVSEKFRTGMVDKTARALKTGVASKKHHIVLLKLIHFLGNAKDYVIGGLPASFLWVISRLMNRRGGIMFAILKKS